MVARVTIGGTEASVSRVKPRLSVSVADPVTSVSYVVPVAETAYVFMVVSTGLDTTGRFKYLTDLAYVADSVRYAFTKQLADSVSTDTHTEYAFTKARADSVAPTDALHRDVSKGLLDLVSMPDALASAFSKFVADVTNMQDATNTKLTKAAADAFFLTDSSVHELNKGLSDSVTMVDSLYRVLVFIRNLVDTVSVPDVYASLFTKAPFTEGVTATDVFDRLAHKYFYDGFAMNDGADVGDGSTYSFSKGVSNVVFVPDQRIMSVEKPMTDSVGFTESGLVVAQSYCDITYFAEDYVGASVTF